jgi:hypothetical protein
MMPNIDGTAAALAKPMKPFRISSVIPEFANPAAMQNIVNIALLIQKISFLPNRSAKRAKQSRKAPPERPELAAIQVISTVVMLRSRPTKAESTVTAPEVKDPMPTAIVATKTKSTSWVVLVKHFGLSPSGSFGLTADISTRVMVFGGKVASEVRWRSAEKRRR